MKYILLLLIPVSLFAQKMPLDTIYGKVESVREKMIFLDSVRQGFKLFENEDEWGHHGFMDREYALQRNYTFWYHLPWVQYVNYFRTYDSIGNFATEKWYKKNGQSIERYEFKFNNERYKVQEIEIDDEYVESGYTRRWGYNHHNKITSVVSFFNHENGYRFEGNIYNDNGNLIEETTFYDDFGWSGTTIHSYVNGKKNKTYYLSDYLPGNKYNHDRISLLRFEYKYDERGNTIEIKDYYVSVFDEEGYPPRITTMEYDEKNNLTRKKYDRVHSKSKTTYKYNRKNQLIEEKYYSNSDKLYRSLEYTYKKDKISKLIFEEDGRKYIVDFDYKIDKHGNWTEQTKSVNGKKLYIRKRDIKYRE